MLISILNMGIVIWIIIVGVFCVLSTVESGAGCERGWRRYGGHCYYRSTDKVKWTKARDDCRNKSGNLVSIHSKEEHEFIISLIGDESRWIGLYRSTRWNWADGSIYMNIYINSTYWAAGEPNNSGTCVRFRKHKLRDSSCNRNRRYICKTVATTTTVTTPTTTTSTTTTPQITTITKGPTTTTNTTAGSSTTVTTISKESTTAITTSTAASTPSSINTTTSIIGGPGNNQGQNQGLVLPLSVTGALILLVVVVVVVTSIICIKRRRQKPPHGPDRSNETSLNNPVYTNDDSQVTGRGSPPPTYEMATSPAPYAKSHALPKPMPQKPDEVTPSAHNVAAVRSVPSTPDASTAAQPGCEDEYHSSVNKPRDDPDDVVLHENTMYGEQTFDPDNTPSYQGNASRAPVNPVITSNGAQLGGEDVLYSSVNKPRDDPDDVVLHENTMYGEQTFDPDNTPSHTHESTVITSNVAQPGGEDVLYSSVSKPRDDPDDVVLHENTMYAEQTRGPDHNVPQNSGNLDPDELIVQDNSVYRVYGEEVQGDDTTYYNQGQWNTAAGSTEDPDDLVIQDNLAYG